MSVPAVSSNGQLDAQIAELIQCKPLSELEVREAVFRLGCCCCCCCLLLLLPKRMKLWSRFSADWAHVLRQEEFKFSVDLKSKSGEWLEVENLEL